MCPLLHQDKKVDIQSVNKVPIYTRTKKVSLIRLILLSNNKLIGLVLHCIQTANRYAVYDRIKRKVNIDSVLQVIRKGTHWSALYVNQTQFYTRVCESVFIQEFPSQPNVTQYLVLMMGFPQSYAKIAQVPLGTFPFKYTLGVGK